MWFQHGLQSIGIEERKCCIYEFQVNWGILLYFAIANFFGWMINDGTTNHMEWRDIPNILILLSFGNEGSVSVNSLEFF